MTAPRTDEEIADFLIGTINMTWDWKYIDSKFSWAFDVAAGTTRPMAPGGAAYVEPQAHVDRTKRVREIIESRRKTAKKEHSDSLAKPSGT